MLKATAAALDRSADNWARHLGEIKRQAGDCRTDSLILPQGAMAGTFSWSCDRGELRGYLLLAPTRPATIQQLEFDVVPTS